MDVGIRGDMRWWAAEEGRRGNPMVSMIKRIHRDQWNRRQMLSLARELYQGAPSVEASSDDPTSTIRRALETDDVSVVNVIESVVDTLHSEICSGRPRPMFLTIDGDYDLYTRTKKLTKFVDGQFDAVQMHEELAPALALDGLIYGSGVMKTFSEHDAICVDVVHPSEIYVDETEYAKAGRVQSMYQVKYFDRYRLAEIFPDYREAILAAARPGSEWSLSYDSTCDQVVVFEGWHLPSGPDAGDGRHVVTLGEIDLCDEDWDRPRFPFSFWHWKKTPRRFWGTGIAEQLLGLQRHIDLTIERIEQGQSYHANPVTYVNDSTNLELAHLTNEFGNVVRYSGPVPPTLAVGNSIGPDIYNWLAQCEKRAFDRVGMSSLMSRAERPAGVTSGRAIRTLADSQSKRFLRAQRAYENTHMDVAELQIAEARVISERNPDYDVVYRGKHNIERIAFKDVDLDADRYKLQVFPTNILPTTPGAKIEAVQELVQAFGLDKEAALRLMDMPDLESETSLITAPREIIEMYVERMLDGKPYVGPEEYMNLPMTVYIVGLHYLRARVQNVPEKVLANLRQFIEDTKTMILEQQAKNAPPIQAAPMPGAPPTLPPQPMAA